MSAALTAPPTSIPPEIPRYLLFKVANERIRREPLLTFGWPGEPHKRAARYHAQGIETLFRGSNDAAKTGTGSAIVTAICCGMKELCGIPLPDLPMPVVWWVLVQTYKQQVDASQRWILKWLGEHPYKTTKGAKGYVEHIHIATPLCKHGKDEMKQGGFECSTCSKIVFHCAESPSGIGGKIDGVWADEPPDEKTWREMRRRGQGNRLFYKLITATPIDEYWWHWMPGDFDGVEDKPRGGRVEVRATMDDNRFLLPAVKAQKTADTIGDPHEKARMFGDYVNIVGTSPFPTDRLEAWAKRCRPPIRTEKFAIRAEQRTDEGNPEVQAQCLVDIWHEWEEDESYIGILDPSLHYRPDSRTGLIASRWERAGSSARGVPDPSGLHIYSRRKPRLCARFIGYTGAAGLGYLGWKLARRYGNALLDIDLTGGYGEATVKTLTGLGYYRLQSYSRSASKPTSTGTPTIGFSMNPSNRGDMVSAITVALLSDSVECASADAVKSLSKVTYVKLPSGRMRAEAAYGANDEDMICMGRFLCLHNSLRLPAPKALSAEDKLARLVGRPLVPMKLRGRPHRGVLWAPR